MEDHIILICGLWSSRVSKYRRWAYDLANRLGRYYEMRQYNQISFEQDLRIYAKEDLNLVFHIASSDGGGEDQPIEAVRRSLENGKLRHLIIGGHSNGVRDGTCKISEAFFPSVPIPYAFAIDTTLAERGRKVFGNVKYLDEFWAGLARINFDDSFNPKPGENYLFHDLDKIEGREVGHIECASLPYVQDEIVRHITSVVPASAAPISS